MTRAEWAITRTVAINNKFSVDITAGPAGFTVEWSPRTPRPGDLTKRDLNRYRRARDLLLQEVAARLGGRIMVVET
jgi:hypothetical protein